MWVFSLCAFAFLCVALGGAPRLIAAGADGEPLPSAAPVKACLTAADASAVAASEADRPAPSREDALPLQADRPDALSLARVRRDANGNVLAARSYLRAVYQAFALGDGFA